MHGSLCGAVEVADNDLALDGMPLYSGCDVTQQITAMLSCDSKAKVGQCALNSLPLVLVPQVGIVALCYARTLCPS
jgi:hypothetical protein